MVTEIFWCLTMKSIFTVLRVSFLFALFFLVCLILTPLVLKNWSGAGQVLASVFFTTTIVWWLERRRRNKRSLDSPQNSSSRHKPKNSSKSNVSKYKSTQQNALRKDENPTATFQTDSWIPATESASVAGRNIGGLVYVGTPHRLDSYSCLNVYSACIDPSLTVARDSGDPTKAELSYWPSYSDIPPQSRAAYLDWLATGRSDTSYDPGFVFLYFYGLERRYFVDTPNSDSNEIIKETIRLRSLYSSNRSIQRYLSEFLDLTTLCLLYTSDAADE